MAQTSLTPQKRTFDDPAKAREAGLKARRRHGQLPTEYRQLRQHQVIEMRLKGMTVQAIADHFNVHYTTIDADLKAIKRDGLLEKFERKILGRLMPKVVTKLEKLLDKDDDNLEPVKEVMKFFSNSHQQKFAREQAVEGGPQEESFEAWVREWQAKVEDATPPADAIDVEEIKVGDAGSNHSEQVLHERTIAGDAEPDCSGTTESACADAPPESHQAAGETRPDASGDAGSAGAGGPGAEGAQAPTGAYASEARLAVGRAAEVGAAAVDADSRSEPETTG